MHSDRRGTDTLVHGDPARLAGRPTTVYVSGQIGADALDRCPQMIALRTAIVDEIPHLRRYALRLAQDTDAADDLVQDCIERALLREHQWDPATRLRPWLFRIEHNLHVSARRRRTPETHGAEIPADLPAPASRPEAALDLRAVLGALRRIPPEQAETLLLVALYELDYKTTADILDIPVGTVRSRMSRGRALLRGILGTNPAAT